MATEATTPLVYSTEVVALASLRAHPQNYREHPAGQRRHLVRSIRRHGFYRNVVVANDGTILAGHGVVEAAKEAGLDAIPIVRLDLAPDDPEALKVLTGDNEIASLALIDDERLATLLATVKETSADALLGTGYEDGRLDELLRLVAARGGAMSPEDEWVGMPPYEQPNARSAAHATIHFASEEDADAFFALIGRPRAPSLWWPEHDGHVGSNVGEAWVADA